MLGVKKMRQCLKTDTCFLKENNNSFLLKNNLLLINLFWKKARYSSAYFSQQTNSTDYIFLWHRKISQNILFLQKLYTFEGQHKKFSANKFYRLYLFVTENFKAIIFLQKLYIFKDENKKYTNIKKMKKMSFMKKKAKIASIHKHVHAARASDL